MILSKPGDPFGAEVVAGGVVDDEEYFAAIALNEPLEKAEEAVTVENVREGEFEARLVEGNGPEDVSRLALAPCCDSGGWPTRAQVRCRVGSS